MRDLWERSGPLFSFVSIEELIRMPADQVLVRLNPTFCALYAAEESPSVLPEQLLLASLLLPHYGIQSAGSYHSASGSTKPCTDHVLLISDGPSRKHIANPPTSNAAFPVFVYLVQGAALL